MPDGFQAEPPRWSPDQARDYHRYSEVNLRKPEKRAAGGWWIIIALVAAFFSVSLIAVLAFALFLPSTAPVAVAVAVPAPAPAPVADPAANVEEVRILQGTWVATAVTIDGVKATDEEVAKVKLTMNLSGFRMDLPMTTTKGAAWSIKADPLAKADWNIWTTLAFRVDDGSTIEAIYELDGGTLEICMGQKDKPCPTDFTAKKGSGRTLLIMKRQVP